MKLVALGLLATAAWGASIPFHFELAPEGIRDTCQFVAHAVEESICLGAGRISLYRAQAGSDGSFISLQWENAREGAGWEPTERAKGTTRYRSGSGEREAAHYSGAKIRDIYPGIDLVVYGNQGHLEYDFWVSPGADLSTVRIRVNEESQVRVSPEGVLELQSGPLRLTQRAPVAFQRDVDGVKQPVEARFRLVGKNLLAIEAGAHDPARELVIDPVLESTVIGGGGSDVVAGGDAGRAVVGTTTSFDFPGASGAHHSNQDIFIYSPDTESTMIIGGTGDDVVTSVVAQGRSNYPGFLLVIGGYTNSRDLPVIDTSYAAVPYQTVYGGGAYDGFFLVFYSSLYQPGMFAYYGGTGDDRILGADAGNGYISFVGSTTSPNLPLRNAFQPKHGGGVDGFIFVTNTYQVPPSLESYMGGPGDERLTAVTSVVSNNNVSSFYLGGESNSATFPLSEGWRNSSVGNGDGFVVRARSTTNEEGIFKSYETSGRWLAGTGADRVTAITALSSGELAVAGVTASNDFSLEPLPKLAFAGGASDGFLARLSATLEPIRLTGLGGSGADEALAVARSEFDEVLVGGWTNSTDFPVYHPLQADFAGGASDGFLYQINAGGSPMLATYLGGAGADRIRYVSFEDGPGAYFSGETDGRALTPVASIQGSISGTQHGFYGRYVLPLLRAKPVRIGRDLAAPMSLRLSDADNYIGVPVTITSSDPGRVVLIGSGDESSAASLTLASGSGNTANSSFEPARRSFRAECLAGDGKTALTLAAPGYEDATVDVECVPSAIVVSTGDIRIGYTSATFPVYPAALNAATQAPIEFQLPRSGMPITVNLESADPAVAVVGLASVTFNPADSAPYPSDKWTASVGGKAPGETFVRFSTDASLPIIPAQVHVTVSEPSSLGIYVPPLARNIAVPINWNIKLPPGTRVTLTSLDPSRMLFSTGTGVPGQNPLTVTFTENYPPVFAFGMGDGPSVRFTVSAPGYGTGSGGAVFGELTAIFLDENGSPVHTTTLAVGSTFKPRLRTYVRVPGGGPYQNALNYLRQGIDPVRVSVRSTDSQAGTVSTPGWEWAGGFPAVLDNITVDAKAPGTFQVLPVFDPESVPAIQVEPLTVKVLAAKFSVDPVTVGKNLQQGLSINTFGLSGNLFPVRVTSRDPARLLVSTDFQPGSASVSSTYNNLTLQALAGAGTVTVDVETATGLRTTATVTLAPSTVAWGSDRFLFAQYGGRPQVGTYAVDPAGGALLAQSIRPGYSGVVRFDNSDATVATVAEMPLSSGSSRDVPFTAKSVGETTIRIIQPEGFDEVGRPPLRVKIPSDNYRISFGQVGVNMQTQLGVGGDIPLPAEVTLISGDPSKLLFSTSATEAGSGSLTVQTGSGSVLGVYAQALGGPVDVKVTLAAGDRTLNSAILPIQASWVSINAGPYRTLVEVDPFEVEIRANPGLGLRAGLNPQTVEIRNSRPDVVSVERLPILNSGLPGGRMRIKPLAPGTAALTVVPPPGFRTAPIGTGTVNITVDGQEWVLPEAVIGKDLRLGLSLNLRSGFSQVTADSVIRISSGNPNLVQLSLAQDQPGLPFVEIPVRKGDPVRFIVYASALADQGEVRLSITAPGYADSSSRVVLAPALMLPDLLYNSINLTQGDVARQLYPGPAVAGGGSATSLRYQLRPEVGSYNLRLTSSNPAVMTVTPENVVLRSTDTGVSYQVRGVGRGTAEVIVTGPDGTLAPTRIPFTVEGGTLSVSTSGPIGRNLQDVFSAYLPSGTTVTMRSADPQKLLISASASQVGGASATITGSNGPVNFYGQALVATGTVRVTASAPGYNDWTQDVALGGEPQVILRNAPSPLTLFAGGEATLDVVLKASQGFSNTATWRAGAPPFTVQINSSNAQTGAATPAQVTFSAGESTRSVVFRAAAPGSTTLSLSVPSGFVDPQQLRQVPVTVNALQLQANTPLRTAFNLLRTISFSRGTSSGTLAATFTSSDPARLLFWDSNTQSAVSTYTMNFRVNETFAVLTVIGRSSSGTVAIQAAGPGLPTASFNVALQPSGFAIGPPLASVRAGSSTFFSISCYALDPQTLQLQEPLGVWPGAGVTRINLVSSDAGIARVQGVPFAFPSGTTSTSISVEGLSAGTATLTLEQPAAYTIPATGTKAELRVQ